MTFVFIKSLRNSIHKKNEPGGNFFISKCKNPQNLLSYLNSQNNYRPHYHYLSKFFIRLLHFWDKKKTYTRRSKSHLFSGWYFAPWITCTICSEFYIDWYKNTPHLAIILPVGINSFSVLVTLFLLTIYISQGWYNLGLGYLYNFLEHFFLN